MTTSGGTGRQPGEVGRGGGAVAACVAVTAVALAFLHLDGVGVVDPVVQTISDYVALPGGYALLGVAAVALAAAVALVAGGLRSAGLADPTAPAGLLVAAAVGLTAAAVFPTNDPGTAAGAVATVHRLGGAVVLVTLPLAAWLVARRAARTPAWRPWAPALSWTAGGTAALSTAFLLIHVPIVIADSSIFPAVGALQRVVYAMVMVALLVLARAIRSASRAARSHTAALRGGRVQGDGVSELASSPFNTVAPALAPVTSLCEEAA